MVALTTITTGSTAARQVNAAMRGAGIDRAGEHRVLAVGRLSNGITSTV